MFVMGRLAVVNVCAVAEVSLLNRSAASPLMTLP
jgi:hypothetical protein